MRTRIGRAWLWVVVAALGAGCSVSPQPEPPSVVGETVSILLDGSGVARVLGEPGTIEPPGALVRVRNLDAPMDPGPVETTSNEDGSFELELPGMEGEGYRLQAIVGDARSRPIDLIGPPPGMRPPPLRHPFDDCFTVAGGTYVDLGAVVVGDVQSARVEMDNRCDVEVVVEGAFPRMDPGVFAMTGAPPVFIPPGTTRFFVVTLAPVAPGPIDALIDVRIGPPAPHSRAVTVVGVGIAE